ncbi:venom dipeptidyl peptidase 4-like isoform X2 [Artemia franciscana]|uniref:Venom dipeptidyl peptidase 4 n=2 Tax=Artemia franciscana TaxID=6661 RepID=A0AA88L9Y8_ARTSF|nr:hypothetical protein QYM36_002973 [Artemia franciscana]
MGDQVQTDPADLNNQTKVDIIDDLVDKKEVVTKKKGRVAAIIGIMAVVAISVGIIAGIVVGFSNGAPSPKPLLNGFTLDDILYSRYYPRDFNGTWISDTEFLYDNQEGDLQILDVATQSSSTLLTANQLSQWKIGHTYWLSKDRQFLLFNFDVTRVWRHSTKAKYSVLDIANNNVYPISIRNLPDQDVLQYAAFSPGDDNSIIFVFENDIYYMPSPTSPAVRITSDGSEFMFNGIPDWVYEEEVLSSDNAIWFSPSGSKIAFATFNDLNVQPFSFPIYGNPGDLDWQYTKNMNIMYPKPGTTNPNAVISLFNASSVEEPVQLVMLTPPEEVPSDCLFTTATWVNEEAFFVVWSNRVQNQSYFSICDSFSGDCNVIHSYASEGGWNEFFDPPIFNSDGSMFVILHPVEVPLTDSMEAGKYKHVVLFDQINKSWSYKPLTFGHFEITRIISFEENRGIVYAIGTDVAKPSQRHLYEIQIDGNGFVCLTCNTGCTWNNARFSSDASYYAHSCNGPNVPEVRLRSATDSHNELLDWELNLSLKENLKNVSMPTNIYMRSIKIGPLSSPYYANVKLIMPQDFDIQNPASKKYPVLVNVYGGPSSQQVTEAFSISWGHYYASQGIIYAYIDGRGSGYQGENILFEIYRGMGTVEVEDQITVMKELKKEPFVDGSKTAIWGWSYGGFATASALEMDIPDALGETAYRCGMSVAPVTNWIYYDSIYTERYMSTPQDNALGYNTSDVTRNVENIRHKKFYLLHGTADDNVHYQQAMMLAKVLEKEDILFHSQSYPDENHGINLLKRHVYHSLTAFLMDDCFHMVEESN